MGGLRYDRDGRMDDRPRNLKTMLSEAKDTSELMVDLAYAALYFGVRKLLLKETGRKLAHVEKQLRTGQSISQELTERLKEHSL